MNNILSFLMIVAIVSVTVGCNDSSSNAKLSGRSKEFQGLSSAREINDDSASMQTGEKSGGANARAISPEVVAVENVAVEHLRRLRMLPKQYEVRSRLANNVWYVTVTRISAVPGGHTMVIMDQFKRIVKVSHGLAKSAPVPR